MFQNGRFYDTWAFSRNGHGVGPFLESETEAIYGAELIAMDTMGGVMLMDADVLRAGVRYTEGDVDRGLVLAARAKGYSAWADPTVHVYHG